MFNRNLSKPVACFCDQPVVSREVESKARAKKKSLEMKVLVLCLAIGGGKNFPSGRSHEQKSAKFTFPLCRPAWLMGGGGRK
ncbi:MAG: hypothetical protein AB1781_03315 [Pseudomonadota bacterium]